MEFTYSLPEKQEAQTPTQTIIEALGKNALGNQAEDLLDKPESPGIEKLKNDIESQSLANLLAITQVMNQLNALRSVDQQLKVPSAEDITDALCSKLEKWQRDGSLDWCNEYINKNGGNMNLVATPNTIVTPQELITLAQTFAGTQNPSTNLYLTEELYIQYNPQELAGPPGFQVIDAAVPNFRFSLIPSKMDSNTTSTTVEHQKQMLQAIQSIQPNIQVPSPLDAVTNWYTLRAKGGISDDEDIFENTYVRHYNMQFKQYGGLLVPATCIHNDDGRPALVYSDVSNGIRGRVSIG